MVSLDIDPRKIHCFSPDDGRRIDLKVEHCVCNGREGVD